MTPQERFQKVILFVGATVYYLGGYFFLNYWSFQRGVFHDLTLPGEAMVPFVPQLIFGYLVNYPMIIWVYLRVQDLSYFKRCAFAFSVCVTVHLAIFFFFPVRYNLRPVINPDASWLMAMIDFYYWLDLPYNCFPSLHVSNAFLVYLLLRRYGYREAPLFLGLSILLMVVVVLIKQHYILDSLAAIPVAFFSLWVAFRDK
ncbi:MAG: phosphatase PAP2 family protein, partial [Deltaproteobacteria bacterium]|nr:phosphatase PAP2 family protein [Deltaproteobacteria bacterium]